MEIFVKEHIFSHEKLTLQMFLTSASSYLASKRRCLKNINYQPCNDVGTQNEVPIQSIISHGRRCKSRCLLKRHTIRKSAENSTSCSIMNYQSELYRLMDNFLVSCQQAFRSHIPTQFMCRVDLLNFRQLETGQPHSFQFQVFLGGKGADFYIFEVCLSNFQEIDAYLYVLCYLNGL